MISNGNHIKLARFVFASLTEQDIEKIVEDKDSQTTKRSRKVAKELFADY